MSGRVVVHTERFEVLGLDGGYLVYDGAEMRLLSGTAARVYAEVDGVSTDNDIAARIGVDYPVADVEGLKEDVVGFVRRLAVLGILATRAELPEAAHLRPAHVGYVRDGGMGLLADLQDGRRRALSSTGVAVWESVVKRHYASYVVVALHEQFPDAPSSLRADIEALLNDLVAEGFLLRTEPTSPSR